MALLVFKCRSMDAKSGPCAYKADTLLPEPSPEPPLECSCSHVPPPDDAKVPEGRHWLFLSSLYKVLAGATRRAEGR